jgi:predicted nucleic-acid-binding protein
VSAADSNLIIRLLTGDDPDQVAAVHALLDRMGAAQDTLFVPLTVILEVEWVLRSRYAFDKAQVVSKVVDLLETSELDFQDEPVIEQAIALYRDHDAEFADCVHLGAAVQHARQPLLTFDRVAAQLPGAQLIS